MGVERQSNRSRILDVTTALGFAIIDYAPPRGVKWDCVTRRATDCVADPRGERVPDGHGQRGQFRPSESVFAAQSAVAAALPHAVLTSVHVARR